MIIGLLTGRGGSEQQSLPYKNTYPILGKPLMLYPFFAAKKSKYIDDIYLSTNGSELKEVARENDIKIIARPNEFAESDSQHNTCINHALKELNSINIDVEIIVILMCNVAIQPDGAIDKCIEELLKDPSLDSAVTVRDWGDHHPTRAKTIDENNLLQSILPENKTNVSTTRQLLGPCFYLDHQVWAIRVKNGKLHDDGQGPWYWMGEKIKAVENKELVIDIHSIEDVKYSELWIKSNRKVKS
tara:strand:- start:4656 stop:5384 length:729 start_codon:yes stop_codon:yes gene_type:complete